MTYYLLPQGNINLSNCFQLELSLKNVSPNILSPSLTNYLFQIMAQTKTETYFKLQNEIHPYSNMMQTSPYTEHYFEIIEIMQTMHLNKYLDSITKNIPLRILSFENNSGIEAIQSIRGKKDLYIRPNHQKNVELDISIFEEAYLGYAANVNVILADSTKYAHMQSVIIELCMCLCVQNKKGVLIWKIGDCFTQIMLETLYFISSFYEKTYIIKPSIMDVSKPERYVICKGFLCDKCYSNYTYLLPLVKQLNFHLYQNPFEIPFVHSFLQKKIPQFFIGKLEEVNYILGQSQLEQIHYMLLLLSHKYKEDKKNNITKQNEQKCLDWKRKHRYFAPILSIPVQQIQTAWV